MSANLNFDARREPVVNCPAATTLTCPDCGAPMTLVPGQWGLYYSCTRREETGCRGAHGAHPDGRPMGTPADFETRQARIAAHGAFDEMWKSSWMTRKQAYRWMRRAMGLTEEQAHIGQFTVDQCEQLVALVAESSP